ncbi:MAG: 50S ribosomal protein L24 [Patescibacteria group bacterium]
MSYKIKKGDTVVVIAGAFKGTIGTVSKVDVKNERVYVSGVKPLTKYRKKNLAYGLTTGSQNEVSRPVHISNVMYYIEADKKATKVGYEVGNDGVKNRIAKKTKAVLPSQSKTK